MTMYHADLIQFSDMARRGNILFCYVGYFSQHVVTAMAETVRARLESSGAAGPTRRKLFSSFVELSQNIIHYSAESLTPPSQLTDEMRRGSVCIGCHDDHYFLLSSNPVASSDVERIRSRIEPLRSMSLEQIKLAYKQALREENSNQSKGAGLGFLTIARDASAPLNFEFIVDPDDADITFFCIQTSI